MNIYDLNGWIYKKLAEANGAYLTFDELDQKLAKDAPEHRGEVRRSYLRGELGMMLRAGQIVRSKTAAAYRIGDDALLF